MPNDCAQAQAKLEQYSEAVADSRAAFNNASGADDSAGHLAVRPLWLSRHVVEAGDVALFERTREEGVGKGVVDQGGDGPLEGAGTCVVFFCCYCFLFER